jgi:hypothetical protein
MNMYEPNGLELWRERRAELLREAESYRLARQVQAARRVESTRHRGRVVGKVLAALHVAGEEA